MGRNGEKIPVSLCGSVVHSADGRVESALIVVHDLRELIEAREVLRQVAEL